MSQQNPLIRRYLDQLDAGLVDANIHADERRDIRQDIDGHLTEALRSGTSLADAITRLGPADELARAYGLELTLNPRGGGDRSPARRLVAALTRTGTLLASVLLAIVMGSLGLGLLVGGFVAIVGGLVAPFLPPTWLDPTLRPGLPQLVVAALGVMLLAMGIPLLRLVRVNLRFLFKTLRGSHTRVSK